MSIIPRRKTPTTITASAMTINPSDASAVKRVNAAMRPWQQKAIYFYGQMGTIHYPANYFAKGLSRYRLFIGERAQDNPTGDPSERTGTDRSELYRKAEDILLSLSGDAGGHDQILHDYGLNRMIAAECYLTGQDRGSKPTNWEILSILELRASNDGTFLRFPAGLSTPDTDYIPAFTERFWQRNAFASDLADGPMESLGADCERLLLLEQSMTARITSALAQAGYLYITTGMTMAGAIEAPTGDGHVVRDPMAVALFRDAEKSILEGTGRFLPSLIRGPSGEKPEFITIDRTIDRVEMELRAEMRSNIAEGLDLPKDALSGMGSGSHWSTWAIGDDTVQNHLDPAVADFCSGLDRVYLWPLLVDWNEANGNRFDLSDIHRLSVMGDGSGVVSRPNSSEDTRQLYDRFAVGQAALRKSVDADGEDAPDDDEYVRMVGAKINNPYLATWGLKVHDKIDWEKVDSVANGPGAPGAGGTPPSRRPADPSKPDPQMPKNLAEQSAEVFAAAAHGHMAAARKQVGAKVRGLAQAVPEAAAIVKPLANEKVLAGLDDWEAIGLDDEKVRAFYAEALGPLAEVLEDSDSTDVDLFVSAISTLATGRQHSPITLADLRKLAIGVLSRHET